MMNQRGATLVEMALVISVVLMTFFSAIQLAMIAFAQTSQDGAAFIASRSYAQNSTAGATAAANAATSIFKRVNAADLSISATGGVVTTSALTTIAGIPVPNTPATLPLESRALEVVGPTSPSPFGSPYPFSASGAKLVNYYSNTGVPNPDYLLGLANPTVSTGNGKNGRFAEWFCRQGVYSGISFPKTRPTIPSANWTSFTNQLNPIYQWDTGKTCS